VIFEIKTGTFFKNKKTSISHGMFTIFYQKMMKNTPSEKSIL